MHAVGRRASTLDLAPRTGNEIAVHLTLVRPALDWPRFEPARMHRTPSYRASCSAIAATCAASPARTDWLDQYQLVGILGSAAACGSAGRGCTPGWRVRKRSSVTPHQVAGTAAIAICSTMPLPAVPAAAVRISCRCTSPAKQPRPRNLIEKRLQQVVANQDRVVGPEHERRGRFDGVEQEWRRAKFAK